MAKHDSLLHKICDSLQPMFYDKYCYIVREGDPIDAVFFITYGTVGTYTSNNVEGSDSQHAKDLEKDKCALEENLLNWFWPPMTYPTYQKSQSLQKPWKHTQKWKPLL